jgi:hypothetical protein
VAALSPAERIPIAYTRGWMPPPVVIWPDCWLIVATVLSSGT